MRAAWLAAALLVAGCQADSPTTPLPTNLHAPELAAVGSVPVFSGAIASTFAVPCFEPGLMRGDNPATCELSAVTAFDGRVLAFNDKPVPGEERSAALRFDPDAPTAKPDYIDGLSFAEFRKYEDAARLPNGEILVTTGFDRVRDDGKWDPFNALFVFRPGSPVRLVAETARAGVRSSLKLRKALQGALADDDHPEGPAYFKVEGLAVTGDGQVLIGIREAGRTYKDFEFRMTILAAAGLEALAAGKLSRAWDGETAPAELTGPLGLSSLGQDHARGGTWLTSSFELGETDEDLGGYLWWLSDKAREAGEPAQLVLGPDGEPLVFAHKPEGVTVLDERRLLVVHDDDRVGDRPPDQISDPRRQFSRGVHESYAEVVVVEDDGTITGTRARGR